MRKKARRHKWNKTSESVPETDEEVHVWGENIGKHIGWFDGEIWYCHAHDPFDVNNVSHFYYFPSDPRPGRR